MALPRCLGPLPASPARGSSSSLLVEGSGSSRMPRESAPEIATAESRVDELSEDEAGGELGRGSRRSAPGKPPLQDPPPPALPPRETPGSPTIPPFIPPFPQSDPITPASPPAFICPPPGTHTPSMASICHVSPCPVLPSLYLPHSPICLLAWPPSPLLPAPVPHCRLPPPIPPKVSSQTPPTAHITPPSLHRLLPTCFPPMIPTSSHLPPTTTPISPPVPLPPFPPLKPQLTCPHPGAQSQPAPRGLGAALRGLRE